MFNHLKKIISSFVPNSEQITQTAWFRDDCELQMLALKLILYEKEDQVTLENFQDPEMLQELKDSVKSENSMFLERLIENIPGGEYLLTRGWFCRSETPYQIRVLMLKLISAEHQINALSGDMLEHLDLLLTLNIDGESDEAWKEWDEEWLKLDKGYEERVGPKYF